MDNNIVLKNLFISTLEINENLFSENLEYQGIPQWDSIGQMYLVSEVENVFDLEFESDEILEIKDYKALKKLLKEKGVQF